MSYQNSDYDRKNDIVYRMLETTDMNLEGGGGGGGGVALSKIGKEGHLLTDPRKKNS